MGGTEATIYDSAEQGAAWITLNRPESGAMRSPTCWCRNSTTISPPPTRTTTPDRSSLPATASAFCSGADLKNPPGKAAPGAMAVPYPDVLSAILESPKPVIAAVNGAAFAGGLGLVGCSGYRRVRRRRAVQLQRGAHRRYTRGHLRGVPAQARHPSRHEAVPDWGTVQRRPVPSRWASRTAPSPRDRLVAKPSRRRST